jgi:hypothetical protein
MFLNVFGKNSRFIGIGFDSRFVQSFVKDGYFKGG